MALWLLAGTALAAAGVALVHVRRVTRRFERLAESYWELRYEYGQLDARVARLDGPPSSAAEQGVAGGDGGKVAFVPLSSLKR